MQSRRQVSLSMTSKSTSKVEYSVVLHEAEEGGYWVEVPALPGCYSQGESREEALANVREAIELYVETLQERGDDVPKDEDVVFTVTVAA
jgi:predicted RNase H-like HicB family nuclease